MTDQLCPQKYMVLFVKKTSMVYYSQEAFRREAADIVRLAETEGLTAHARAVKVRLK